MNENQIAFIQEQIGGYRFNNPGLLEQAFTRRSYSEENGGENNEVLEFYGDKVLDFIVVKLFSEWYGRNGTDYEEVIRYIDRNPNGQNRSSKRMDSRD